MTKKFHWLWPLTIACLLAGNALGAASPFTDAASVDWQGKPVTLDRLAGRTTVVIASSNAVKDVGAIVDEELLFRFGSNPNFQLIRVVDLVNVPTFAADIVIDRIRSRDNAELRRIADRQHREGVPVAAPVADIFFILDWEGRLRQALLAASPRPEYQVFKTPLRIQGRYKSPEARRREDLDNHLHVFVLGADASVQAHYLDTEALSGAVADLQAALSPPLPSVPGTTTVPGVPAPEPSSVPGTIPGLPTPAPPPPPTPPAGRH